MIFIRRKRSPCYEHQSVNKSYLNCTVNDDVLRIEEQVSTNERYYKTKRRQSLALLSAPGFGNLGK